MDRLTPRAGARVQITVAAVMWLVGATIMLVRGVVYVSDRHWHAWALSAALAVGVVKSRYVLDDVAARAVERIRARGWSCVFGFFSLRSWTLVAVMMGGGIAIRNAVMRPGVVGAGILGAAYLGIGTALLLADRVFWHAVFDRDRWGRGVAAKDAA